MNNDINIVECSMQTRGIADIAEKESEALVGKLAAHFALFIFVARKDDNAARLRKRQEMRNHGTTEGTGTSSDEYGFSFEVRRGHRGLMLQGLWIKVHHFASSITTRLRGARTIGQDFKARSFSQ